MKLRKMLLILLTVCLLSGLLGSCRGDYLNDHPNKTNETECLHSWENATCEAPRTCTKCGTTFGKALGHTTTTGECTRCNKIFGTWELKDVIDVFKEPTGEQYVSTQVTGLFSNSETSDSKLTAVLEVSSNHISIMLWKYGSELVKCSNGRDPYNILMKDTNGQKYLLHGAIPTDSSRIFFDDEDEAEVLNALKQTGSVSFYITPAATSITNYLFTVETSNFSILYSSLK